MKIIIGSDHAGFKLKEAIKKYLEKKEYEVEDKTPILREGDDYPEIAEEVSKEVIKKKTRGILICGTGIGMSIASNKVRGIRAALVRNKKDAIMSRKHNNANIICLGGRITKQKEIPTIINAFLKTKFEGEKKEGKRHLRRIKKISKIEKNNC